MENSTNPSTNPFTNPDPQTGKTNKTRWLALIIGGILIIGSIVYYFSGTGNFFKGSIRIANQTARIQDSSKILREKTKTEDFQDQTTSTSTSTTQTPAIPATIPDGQTVFDKTSLSANGDGFNSKGSQIFYDSTMKSAISLQLIFPTYSTTLATEVKEEYLQPLSLKVCNENLSNCQNIIDDTSWIYSEEKKFSSNNVDQYKSYNPIISNKDLVNLLKKLMTEYNGKFFFIFTVQDPTGVELKTNTVELVVDKFDQEAIMAAPIEGNIFDANTFIIKSASGYPMADNQISYNAESNSALTLKYQMPNVKPGATENQYMQKVTLEYCGENLAECVTVFTTGQLIVFTKYPDENYQNKQYIIPNKDLDKLIKDNPEKSTFRFSIPDPNGAILYTANTYQVIKE